MLHEYERDVTGKVTNVLLVLAFILTLAFESPSYKILNNSYTNHRGGLTKLLVGLVNNILE